MLFRSTYLLYTNCLSSPKRVLSSPAINGKIQQRYTQEVLNPYRSICQEIHANTVFLCPDLVTACIKWLVSEVPT